MGTSDGLTSYLDREVQSQLRRGQVESEQRWESSSVSESIESMQCRTGGQDRNTGNMQTTRGEWGSQNEGVALFGDFPAPHWTALDQHWAGPNWTGLGPDLAGPGGLELDRCTNSAFTRATRTK